MHQLSQPLVSVLVISYNQENYIKRCLEGIYNQVVNFDYEVIIRDDCSTDNTDKIISEFMVKNPNSHVRYIRNNANEGMGENFINGLKQCRGEYIAICEGDDYWTSNQKLQTQLDTMSSDKSANFCIHPCYLHKTEKDNGQIGFWKGDTKKNFTINDVVKVVGQFAPTASYMITSKVVKSIPDWLRKAPVLDFPLEIYALSFGKGIYLPNAMSSYRVFSDGSWSDKSRSQGGIAMIEKGEKLLELHKKLENEKEFKDVKFNTKKSGAELNIALGHLLLKNFKNFELHITNSWREHPGVSSGQKIYYKLRKIPQIARLSFIIKFNIYRKFRIA